MDLDIDTSDRKENLWAQLSSPNAATGPNTDKLKALMKTRSIKITRCECKGKDRGTRSGGRPTCGAPKKRHSTSLPTRVRERCRSASAVSNSVATSATTASTTISLNSPRARGNGLSDGPGHHQLQARETGHAVLRRPVTSKARSSSAARSGVRRKSTSSAASAAPPAKPILQMDTLNCPNYTSTEYWDSWAGNWDGEIISSIDEDINGAVKDALARYCPTEPTSFSVDFGCGVGLYLPTLAASSGSVLGLDISRKLLARAREDCDRKGLTNVRLKRADLGTCDVRKLNIENVANFAVCANVLISPEPCTRRSIVANLAASLQCHAHALFVVPAIRSARLIENAHGVWLAERRRLRIKASKEDETPEASSAAERRRLRIKSSKEDETAEASSAADAKRGIYRRDNVRTKHFKEAEIKKLLRKYRLEVVEVSRVEYSWYTEFDDPVDVLEEYFEEKPFDWLVVARKLPKET
eukprot:CAMPEP_0114485706 /NCGR_PEP_ID=MMETSP0104-20121206/20090_1 /TAXON_ID=37642 ORGANISM="Paraphysomonas imperforata, Strain PA2" /NCGR_SAMPLE_ID=MMETSP0104 /ASSEMBLY_ACC=CAM_ASM_000202 /LENGTH=469 /DNA_ID=CAMNT_0001661839 /DNA_START=53 /DNA_END=1463 /DNA_ORIENTATION=+